MTLITATTESKAQVIGGWWAYTNGDAWWSGVRLVAWISQNKDTLETTLYTKWQRNQYNYYPFWLDYHTYSVSIENQSGTNSFNLPQVETNGVYDLTTAKSFKLSHDSTTGEYSGTLAVSGYKTWEAFNENISISFPAFSVTPTPTPTPVEPDPPTPIEFDDDPRYFIYADGNLVYAAGVDGYDVVNPKLTVEVNKAGTLTFDIPVGSEMYNRIDKLKTTVEARQGNEVLFRGRLLNTQRNTMNTITCYCEGFMSWLVDISFQPYSYTGQARDFLKYVINAYNSRASSNRQITYKYSDISAKVAYEQKNYSDAWKEIKSVLIDGVGGYIVPYLTSTETGIQWLSTYGATTSQVIQFGQNLLDFSEHIDASEVFTAVRAFGKEINGTRISLSGNDGFVVDNNAVSVFGRIERTVFFDEIETESALRQAATDYLRTGIQAAMSLSLTAVDMHLLDKNTERIRLGDSTRVVSVPHLIDAFFLCIKIVYDFSHPKNTRYTFGGTQRTISELTDTSYKRYVITEGA